MPKILHQIMPIRGLVPAIVTRMMFSIAPTYMLCMHKADKNLVLNFDNQIKEELLPKWWSNPAEAPIGTQGIKGKYSMKYKQNKYKNAIAIILMYHAMTDLHHFN